MWSIRVAKNNSRVQWISDFRELNKFIKQKVYNLPKIQDILLRSAGYTFLTKLDKSMQYYTFELDDSSKELCTICMPFGNYHYNQLPMGFVNHLTLHKRQWKTYFASSKKSMSTSMTLEVFQHLVKPHCIFSKDFSSLRA
jgi:hypothetical protein